MKIFLVTLLICGLGFIYFHSKVLFKKGYVGHLQKGIWKDNSALDKKTYYYNKYSTGIQGLLIGIILVGFSVFMLLKIYGVF